MPPPRLPLRHRTVWSILAWSWLAAVVFFSLGPSVTEPGALPTDKLYHALAYVVLQWLFGIRYPGRSRHLLLAGGFIGLGVVLELVQGLSPHRLADPWDAAANAFGVIAGILVLRLGCSALFTMQRS